MVAPISPDTQAILLLCSPFTQQGTSDARPLTLTEYNAVAAWLSQRQRRPADLLETADAPLPADEPGLPEVERVRTLLARGLQMAAALEQWQRLGLWVMSREDDGYPQRLRDTLGAAAPVLLYGAGDVTRLGQGGLAIVGSRDIDDEGLAFTRRVGERCALAEMQVVSGGARGVDQAAVAAALQAGGGAVTVLADRLDRTATSREAKELLRRGVLTLVTPFEPESGFSVGKAMGRNKHIYALADHALVVRFTTGEGGTWTGAIEQLKRNRSGPIGVPVFVRLAHNPDDGCRDLQRKGALAFPEEDFWHGSVRQVLTLAAPTQPDLFEAAVGQEVVPPEPAQSPVAAPPASDEVAIVSEYARCLPLLLDCLRDEPGVKQLAGIAEHLKVSLKELTAFLKRAIAEGKVAKKKKNGRVAYAVASGPKFSPLFDGDGDAA